MKMSAKEAEAILVAIDPTGQSFLNALTRREYACLLQKLWYVLYKASAIRKVPSRHEFCECLRVEGF